MPIKSGPNHFPEMHDDAAPRYRSGAVARMARMPVATLRVWERRYRVSAPTLTTSGQRLYSATDVRRLSLIRQLTDQGHAIGALAPLNHAQLQAVAATHVAAGSAPPGMPPHDDRPLADDAAWRVAVVGIGIASRLQRPNVLQQIASPVLWAGPFETLGQAMTASDMASVDSLLIHAPTLHPGWLAQFDATAAGLRKLPMAVLYGFAAETVCQELAAAGVHLMREPQSDVVLGQWLSGFRSQRWPARRLEPSLAPPIRQAHVPARRWSDAALADLAALSTTIACECPRHIADVLLQLTRFEAYSAECENRNTPDAELHAYLAQVTGLVRVQFEAALERVAAAEGLQLPG